MWAVGMGCIFGSFLNALSFRFNTGRTMGGRSRCMRCGHALAAVDLVPVLSYVALRGRCRYCGGKISAQYPLVEVVAGLVSLGVFLQSFPGILSADVWMSGVGYTPLQVAGYAYFLLVWFIILFAVVYDLRHKIIPWSCSLPLAALAFLALCIFPHSFALTESVYPLVATLPPVSFITFPSWWSLLAGPLLALPLFLLSLVSRGQWMGWADSIFELSLGWLLGLTAGLTALMLAVWSGALVGMLLLLSARLPWRLGGKRFTMESEIPFAPFLALGAALAYFFHVDLFSTLPLLFS